MKVAIVGSGISGLAVAHTLRGRADITLFEAGAYFGGHTHTVDITLPTPQGPVTHGVDTGFLVFNERTYPNLINLLGELGVATAPSDMSFSVQVPGATAQGALEWSGASLSTVFAQRGNLLNWRFLKMLRDLLRFNALATRLAEAGKEAELRQPLGEFLRAHRFSNEFRDWYFLPMIGCIWSCPTDQMLQFPVSTMIRFCHNHGLIQVTDRPQWWTVQGGARHYVDQIVAHVADRRLNTPVQMIERGADGVRVITDGRAEHFDRVVLATHSDQALALLRHPSERERELLGAIRYHPNRAVLHTDASVLPQNRAAWAAWNYERAAGHDRESAQVCLHYLINRLQPLPWDQPVVVSLNPVRELDPARVLGEFEYAHPVFDLAALKAQEAMHELQGQHNTWFCGAWMGYGFHEDGLKAGLGVARQLLVETERVAALAAEAGLPA
ncbi:MAG: FAD-dependent oxidoreductase [Ramlibacter sp.]|nr:FAD-dependent oxidoreductase [Ramlibacter sp.]